MPRYIVKLERDDREWLLVWSTVVDAPVTRGMSREEFAEWYAGDDLARAMFDALADAGLRVTYAPFRWIEMLETARRMYDFAFPEADRPSPPWDGA